MNGELTTKDMKFLLERILQYYSNGFERMGASTEYGKIFAIVRDVASKNSRATDDIFRLLGDIHFRVQHRRGTPKGNLQPQDMKAFLKMILEHSKKSGIKPDNGTEYGKILGIVRKACTERGCATPEIDSLLSEILSMPTDKRKKIIDAEGAVKSKISEINTQGVEKQFPRAKLLRVIFGDAEYHQVLSVKNNEFATRIFAEYLDNLISHNFSDNEITMLEKAVGIGVTPQIRAQVDARYKATGKKPPRFLLKTDAYVIGHYADALNPRDIAVLSDYTESRVRQLLNIAAQKFQSQELQSVLRPMFDAYMAGDVDKMISAMPPKQQQIYKMQKEHKISDVSTRDLNAAGKWLMDNMSFQK